MDGRTLVWLLIGLAAIFVAESAIGCRCRPNVQGFGWQAEFERSAAVFAGRVVDYQEQEAHWQIANGRAHRIYRSYAPETYTFEVHAVWKGEVGDHFEIETMASQASCGYPFRMDRIYLVFARENDEGAPQASLCSLTEPWELALRERHRIGSPDRVLRPLSSMPTLERIDAWLDGDDGKHRRAAIDFWRDLDCGIELLYWRINDLPISEIHRRSLMRDLGRAAHFFREAGSTSELAPLHLMPPPRHRPNPDHAPRSCSDATRAWVDRRVRELAGQD